MQTTLTEIRPWGRWTVLGEGEGYAGVLTGGRGERCWYAVKPDEVYHLGAQSHVRVNCELPNYH